MSMNQLPAGARRTGCDGRNGGRISVRRIEIVTADPYLVPVEEPQYIAFTASDYQRRMNQLLQRMAADGYSHLLVYADREHFANLEFLTGFDPRFEEALLVVEASGQLTLVVGNEGWGHSLVSPLPLRRVLYQNFSLQGQPRERLRSLAEILAECRISRQSRLGLVGFKYFEASHLLEAELRHDLPAYVVEEIGQLVPRGQMQNATALLTHATSGLRNRLQTAREVAYFEYIAAKTSNIVLNMLRALQPGRSELQVSRQGGFDGSPQAVFPMINFGVRHVQTGLRSPDDRPLQLGDVFAVACGLRGSLVSRSGIAAAGPAGLTPQLQESISDFYQPYFAALVAWYETLQIGAVCGQLYDAVMAKIGDPRFGVYLNPGHNISTDEWSNSPVFPGSPLRLASGHYLQADVIASASDPFRQAIMEDGVILADSELQQAVATLYPVTWQRIQLRRQMLRDVIGINLHDDVLPMSNCQAVFHPYWLDMSRIFAVR